MVRGPLRDRMTRSSNSSCLSAPPPASATTTSPLSSEKAEWDRSRDCAVAINPMKMVPEVGVEPTRSVSSTGF